MTRRFSLFHDLFLLTLDLIDHSDLLYAVFIEIPTQRDYCQVSIFALVSLRPGLTLYPRLTQNSQKYLLSCKKFADSWSRPMSHRTFCNDEAVLHLCPGAQ